MDDIYGIDDEVIIQILTYISQHGEGNWNKKSIELAAKGINLSGKRIRRIWFQFSYTNAKISQQEKKAILLFGISCAGNVDAIMQHLYDEYDSKRSFNQIRKSLTRSVTNILESICMAFSRKKSEECQHFQKITYPVIQNMFKMLHVQSINQFVLSIKYSAELFVKILQTSQQHNNLERSQQYEMWLQLSTKSKILDVLNHIKYIERITQIYNRMFDSSRNKLRGGTYDFHPDIFKCLYSKTVEYGIRYREVEYHQQQQQISNNGKYYAYVHVDRDAGSFSTVQLKQQLQFKKNLKFNKYTANQYAERLKLLDELTEVHIIRLKQQNI